MKKSFPLFGLLLLGLVAYGVVQNFPDIVRYMRIRQM